MSFERVTAVDDARLDIYRDLPRSNLTRPSGLFIAEGGLVVERLLASTFALDSVLLDERFEAEYADRLPADVPTYVVPHEHVSQIVGFKFHRGILACGRRRPTPRIADLVRADSARISVVVAIDVHDPENMGSILRTSAALGVDLFLATSSCADPFSRRVLRTSMGQVLKLPLRTTDDMESDLTELQRTYGVELAAAVLDGEAEPLSSSVRPPRFGLLLGNEGHGLPAALVARCDRKVTIPMASGVDSLNVAVAAGIVLYHFLRVPS